MKDMKNVIRFFLPALVAFAAAIGAGAQEPPAGLPPLEELVGRPLRVETLGGGVFQGTLFSATADRLEILEPDGQILTIARRAVKSYREIPPARGRRSFYQDSASNRLIVIPTGFAMDPGELHISDQEIVVVTASYGAGRRLSLWGGIGPIGALFSARAVFNPAKSLALSAGAFAGLEWVGLSGAPASGALLPYLLGSWGEPDNNLTLGGAWILGTDAGGRFGSLGAIAAVGGKRVLTAATALVSENWFFWGGWEPLPLYGVPGLALRIAGSRFSGDVGAILPLRIRGGLAGAFGRSVIPLPWVSLTYRIR